LKADIPSPFDVSIDWVHPFPLIATFGTTALYLFLITCVFPRFKPSKETIARISFWHYGGLFVYSTVAFAAMFYYLWVNGEFTDFNAFFCRPIPGWLRLLSISFTISKVWEWLDTAILIWKGQSLRKIGFLHIYHHATTVFLFLVIMNKPPTEKSGLLMNGFVHSLMYYHFGFRLPMMFRPIITFAQILQLASSTTFWDITRQSCPAYASFREEHFIEFCVPYLFVPVYLIFFIRFFFEQYITGKKKPAVVHSTGDKAAAPAVTKKTD
jgi:hypothetical protein